MIFVVIKPEQHSLACVLKLQWPGMQKAARQGRRQILMYFRCNQDELLT